MLFGRSAQTANSPKDLNAQAFRDEALEYLEFIDSEVEDDPDLANESHWNLVMRESDDSDEAFFATMIFLKDALEVIAGTGDFADVREVCDQHSLVQVDRVRAALTGKFPCRTLKMSRSDAEKWLGRTWG